MIGYGIDTWCVDTLSPGRYAREATLVAQAIYRRLITPRGTLRGGAEESAYGFDMSAYCGAVGYDTALRALPGLVRGEILKDDRVSPNLEVVPVFDTTTEGAGLIAITVEINVTLADESEDFTLTFNVTSLTTTLLGGLP